MALNTPLSSEQLITNTTELQAVHLVNQSGNTSAQRYQGTHSAPIATLIQLCSHQTKTTDTNNLHREGWLSPRWMHFQRSRLQVNHSYETSSPRTTLPSLHRSSILVWFPFTAAQNLETAPDSLPDDDIISSSPREIQTHAGESARNFPRYLDHRHLTSTGL